MFIILRLRISATKPIEINSECIIRAEFHKSSNSYKDERRAEKLLEAVVKTRQRISNQDLKREKSDNLKILDLRQNGLVIINE